MYSKDVFTPVVRFTWCGARGKNDILVAFKFWFGFCSHEVIHTDM